MRRGDAARDVLIAQGEQALVFSQCRIHLDLRNARLAGDVIRIRIGWNHKR
jgi:hypothetical protein